MLRLLHDKLFKGNEIMSDLMNVNKCIQFGMREYAQIQYKADPNAFLNHPLNFYNFDRSGLYTHIEHNYYAYFFFNLITKSIENYYGNCKRLSPKEFTWICPSNDNPKDPLILNTDFNTLSLQSSKISARCWATSAGFSEPWKPKRLYECQGWTPLDGTDSSMRYHLLVNELGESREVLTEETPQGLKDYYIPSLTMLMADESKANTPFAKYFINSEEMRRKWNTNPKFNLCDAFANTIKWAPQPDGSPEVPKCPAPTPCPDPNEAKSGTSTNDNSGTNANPGTNENSGTNDYAGTNANAGTNGNCGSDSSSSSSGNQGRGFVLGVMSGLIGAVSAVTAWRFCQTKQNVPVQHNPTQKRIPKP